MYKGQLMRYVLSVIDIFSRYLWLVPLPRKQSKLVAKALKNIYIEHGIPNRLQCDMGKEFEGDVLHLCKALKIKVISSSPYHPQSQGKIERSHRTLKQKIMFDLDSMKKKGVNWANNLKGYCKVLSFC